MSIANPISIDHFESDCCHDECTKLYRAEIVRIGFERAEPHLCLVVERQDDERWFQADADFERRFPR